MVPGHGVELRIATSIIGSTLNGEFITLHFNQRQISSSCGLWLEEMNFRKVFCSCWVVRLKLPLIKPEEQRNTYAKFYALVVIIEIGLWCLILAQQHSYKNFNYVIHIHAKIQNFKSLTSLLLAFTYMPCPLTQFVLYGLGYFLEYYEFHKEKQSAMG